VKLISPKQIARRAVLAPNALYHRPAAHGVARSQATRVLHLLLLLAVVHQLISSQFISRPLPGDAPSTLYQLHEYVGMASLAVVCVFWLWTLIRHGETSLTSLFPWLSPRRIAAIIDDCLGQINAIRRRDPSHESSGALASAVHGLGLLVVTAMAATGTVWFWSSGAVAHAALAMHSLVANLMWAYLIGHAGLAALHHLLGSDILLRMFWIRRGITVTTPLPIKAFER
jgi:cytochrome b561